MSDDALHEPFESLERQRNAAELGIWAFLASEAVFFGGMFLGYATYRFLYPEGFAKAGAHTDIFYGTLNTALLLASSGSMAAAVWAGRAGLRRMTVAALAVTLALGLGFLGVKALEYAADLREHLWPGDPGFPVERPGGRIFFSFYWLMTSVHAAHLTIGVGAVATTILRILLGRASWRGSAQIHVLGLYWHLVDLIWIYLYPLFYLLGRS